ncbi:MAG TPA: hypothetical protein VG273_16540 [Bryobacteraceae bacterium]|jgi:hypothetical protein|nr:hypothetical protein [Bryobacteraceae bacterium]
MLDTASCVTDAVYRLGFENSSELTSSSWVTQAELYQFADDAVRKLAWKHGLFIVYDNTISVTAVAGAVYTLPAAHVFTLLAWLAYSGGPVLLRLTTVRDLWALDGAWPAAAAAPPVRASLDAGAVGTITLYPPPNASSTLCQVCQEAPSTVASGASTIQLPLVLQDYFTYAMLAGARGKESDAAVPEMAAHYRERVAMYEAVFDHLWGPGQ